MYRAIKIIQWVVTWLFLMIFYRWMMPNWWVNFFAAFTNLAVFILLSDNFIHRISIPKLFKEHRYYLFAGATFSCFLVNGGVTLTLTWLIIQPFTNSYFLSIFWNWENLIYGNFFVIAAFTAISLMIKLMFDWFHLQLEMQRLEKERVSAELRSLKSQLNPHFLFNSLNTIYGHIDRQNPYARRLLLQFADLLRYQIYDCNIDFIPIEKEIEHLNNYIEIQRQRKSAQTKIDFSHSGSLSGYKIAPLLFTPFVENAFKYLSSYDDGENYVRVDISTDENVCRFNCVNSKDLMIRKISHFENQSFENTAGGIGIENVRKRLGLIYPGKHRLICSDGETKYEVQLEIML